MRKLLIPCALAILCIAVGPTSTFSQVVTGTQPLGSYGGGPVDAINLANLNAHLTVPITAKKGRGLDFSYALAYDSAVWYPSSGVWTPVYNWGWSAETQTATGYVSAKVQTWKCFQGRSWYFTDTYSDWIYVDRLGTVHPFPLPTLSDCPTFQDSANAIASDASGYQISASAGTGVIEDAAGNFFSPPFNAGTGGAAAQDYNGNQITTDGTTFTDTLGTTALTISGSNPMYMSYTAPSGGTASYTVSYASYTVVTNFGCSGITEYSASGVNLIDRITLPDGTYYQFQYEATPGYGGDVTGRLASVRLPTGGTIYYSYSGGSNGITCADGSTATLTRTTPDGTWSYTHSESGAAWTTTVLDPQNNQTILNFQDLGKQAEYQTERQVYQGSSSLLQTVVTCYNGNTSNCNSTAVTQPITQRTAFVQWPSGLESRADALFNGYGLPTEVDEYAYGSGGPGSLQRKTITQYASLGNDIQDRPSSITVEDGSGNIASQTSFQYDQGTLGGTTGTPQHASIAGSRGNATTVTYAVSNTATLARTFTYFDTGNVNVATDVNGAQTTFTYGDCGNSFPTLVNEPMGLQRSMTWNCTGAVETSVVDENSETTSASYTDPYFWRINSATDALLNTKNYSYSTGTTPVEAGWTMLFNSNSSVSSDVQYEDGLGRVYTSQHYQAPGSAYLDTVSNTFDSNGRPYSTTMPCSASLGQSCSTAQTTQTYDALNRPLLGTDGGGGTVTLAYSANDVLSTAGPAPTGENTKRKQLEYDALGRLTSVCEVTGLAGSGTCGQTNPQTGYWTTYAYNPDNQLTNVNQSGQTRSYAYDFLGRMTAEINPESGSTTYVYDSTNCPGNGPYTSNGDLVEKIDAAGDTTCYYYDGLHRLTDIGVTSGPYGGGVSVCKRFRYDNTSGVLGTIPSGVTVTNMMGRLAEAETDSCLSWPSQSAIITDEWFSYDARGGQTDLYESTPHSGGYYHTQANYWPNGQPQTIWIQNGYWSSYNLDGEGRISSNGNAAVTSTTYNAAGQPTQLNFGSGDSDNFTYDPNTGRMTQYKYTVNGQSVVGNLNWNALGTLQSLSITDPFNGSNSQTCSYSHDDLARISGAGCGSIWSQTFSYYDPFGNIEKSGNSNFSATYSPTTDRMITIGGNVPSYDGDGNVTNDYLHTYAWDAFGKPTTIDGVLVTYDALGRMVEQNRSGSYTDLQYSPTGFMMQIDAPSGQSAFVPGPGGAMAIWAPVGILYRHPDWEGSSRLTSTQSQTMYSDSAYAPFGEVYAQGGTSDESFTGKDQDTVSNLYDFPAREYGIQGRWPSPDPAGISSANPADPQSWNRYSYVRNSPLNATDPSGLMMRVSADVEPVGGDDDYLSAALAASIAWGEEPGALIADEVAFGGPSAIDASGLLDSPLTQHKCDGNYCMVGSYNFATRNADGTYTVDWDAEFQAGVDAAEAAINRAFRTLANNRGLTPDQAITIGYNWGSGVWNVWCTNGCSVDPVAASNWGWKDPVTIFHSESWYGGSWFDSLGFDVDHLVVNDGVLGAHVDPFGPFNPLHYLIQIPEMKLTTPTPPGFLTCSLSAGCSF